MKCRTEPEYCSTCSGRYISIIALGLPAAQRVKNSMQCGRPGFHPSFEKIPWRRAWQPTPVLLPGGSHRKGSLAGCSLRGHGESNTTEQLSIHT